MRWQRSCTPDSWCTANQSTPACNSQSKRGSQISAKKNIPKSCFLALESEFSTELHRSRSVSISTGALLVYWTGVPTGVSDKVEWDDLAFVTEMCRNAGGSAPQPPSASQQTLKTFPFFTPTLLM